MKNKIKKEYLFKGHFISFPYSGSQITKKNSISCEINQEIPIIKNEKADLSFSVNSVDYFGNFKLIFKKTTKILDFSPKCGPTQTRNLKIKILFNQKLTFAQIQENFIIIGGISKQIFLKNNLNKNSIEISPAFFEK